MKPSSLAVVLCCLSTPFFLGQGGSGCSAGVRQLPFPATTPSGTHDPNAPNASNAGAAASIKIQPEDVTTVSPDGEQFYADLKGTSDEAVSWEIVGADLVRDGFKSQEIVRASLRPKDLHGKLVRLTPLPEARHLDWFTLKACSVERPDVCDVKPVQFVRDEGLSCLQEIVGGKGSCDGRDTLGALQTDDWSQEMTAGFGSPVDEFCNTRCAGGNAPDPWTLSIRLCGTFFPDCKDYALSPLKEEWRGRVRHLQVRRDPADEDGCPDAGNEEPPCWMTCDGTCAPFDSATKSGKTLGSEGRHLLATYLKDVCAVALEPAEFAPDKILQSLTAALEKASLAQTVQCVEGVLLTATQIIPWIETVAESGIVRDERGEPYTSEQIFTCVKKRVKGS